MSIVVDVDGWPFSVRLACRTDRHYTRTVSPLSVDDHWQTLHQNVSRSRQWRAAARRYSYRKVVNHVAIPVDLDHVLEFGIGSHGDVFVQCIAKL